MCLMVMIIAVCVQVQCTQLECEGVTAVAEHCPKLEHLDLKGVSHVGDVGVMSMCAASRNQLRLLSLGESCITDDIVPHLLESCRDTVSNFARRVVFSMKDFKED